MPTAFAYVRVSTKDQEIQGNSIPEQLFRIRNFADSRSIQIIKTYQEASSAYHDENRDQFNQMITDALQDRPNYIIVDDSSRFARTRDVSASTKKLLRKHGIDVLFASEENIDTKTSAGLWLEGIREIKNEAHSMDISYNVCRGMTGNIKNRDPETGWCYKNGGRAPYGYAIRHLNRGTNSKGKPIIKSIWELHPENSEIARMIIVDLYIKQEMSYQKIRDYLNNNGIQGPEGKPWGTSTIVEMLRDNRLQQYSGTAFWNKENRILRVPGLIPVNNGLRFAMPTLPLSPPKNWNLPFSKKLRHAITLQLVEQTIVLTFLPAKTLKVNLCLFVLHVVVVLSVIAQVLSIGENMFAALPDTKAMPVALTNLWLTRTGLRIPCCLKLKNGIAHLIV